MGRSSSQESFKLDTGLARAVCSGKISQLPCGIIVSRGHLKLAWTYFLGGAVSSVSKIGVGGISGSTGGLFWKEDWNLWFNRGCLGRMTGSSCLGCSANSMHSMGKSVAGGRKGVGSSLSSSPAVGRGLSTVGLFVGGSSLSKKMPFRCG